MYNLHFITQCTILFNTIQVNLSNIATTSNYNQIKNISYLSFHKKKIHFQSSRSKISSIFLTRQGECVFDGEKKKRAQSGTGNRVARVSFANCGWVHAFVSPPETSPMTQTRKRPSSRRRKRKREKKRERKGNRRTRDERFFLRFSSADLPPPPPGWMDTAKVSSLS